VYFVANDEKFAENYSIVGYTFVVITMIVLAYMSHINAIKADPGCLPARKRSDPSDSKNICEKCASDRAGFEPRVHHCRHCRSCVYKVNHHCAWTNNCVGYYNKKAYLLFLFWTFTVIAFQITVGHTLCDIPEKLMWGGAETWGEFGINSFTYLKDNFSVSDAAMSVSPMSMIFGGPFMGTITTPNIWKVHAFGIIFMIFTGWMAGRVLLNTAWNVSEADLKFRKDKLNDR